QLASACFDLLFQIASVRFSFFTSAACSSDRATPFDFVPVERSLRPRVGLFAPLRDKVTSSAQPLVPSGQPSLSILTEPHDELPAAHSITSPAARQPARTAVARRQGGGLGQRARRPTPTFDVMYAALKPYANSAA